MEKIERKSAPIAGESEIIFAIHALFKAYGPTFVDLADGRRSDIDALLNFYGAPLRFIGPSFHLVMTDNNAITGKDGIGGELDRLHQAHLSGSTLEKCDITVLNARAALVEATWLRCDINGALMERFGVLYLVALTTEGWRITSAVSTSD
jgi:hypothetical protein